MFFLQFFRTLPNHGWIPSARSPFEQSLILFSLSHTSMCVGTVCSRMRADSIRRGQTDLNISITRQRLRAGIIKKEIEIRSRMHFSIDPFFFFRNHCSGYCEKCLRKHARGERTQDSNFVFAPLCLPPPICRPRPETQKRNRKSAAGFLFLSFFFHGATSDYPTKTNINLPGSTYFLYSQSESHMMRAETMTTTDPRASARTCRNTPRMFIYVTIN